MRIVSKTQTKTTLLALLTCLIFSACSQLEPKSSRTGSVSFNLNAAREVTSDAGTLVDIELRGDYEASQTVTLSADKKASVTFYDVPVGKNVSVYVQVYTPYDGAKSVTYFGESESKKITSGNNDFTVPLATAYNSIAEGISSCLILKPTFTPEGNNKTLSNNTINFSSGAESFSYKFSNLGNYQKALITIKKNTDGEHSIRPKLVKSATATMYYIPDENGIVIPDEPLELDIMQGINLDAIGFENTWDESNWAADHSITIEKIELFKDSDMIDPDFNVVTKTDTTYTVKNPALQKIVRYMGIEKNKITFTAGLAQSIEGNPYNAAYWEFEDLYKYDRAIIKFSTSQGKKFFVNGFLPQDYSKGINQQHSDDVEKQGVSGEYENRITAEADGSQTAEISISLLTENFDINNLKAIEFKNDSGEDDWTLEIQEIKLERTALSGNVNIYINQSGEEYNRYTYSAGSEERPFKYVSDAFEKIKVQGTSNTEWTILIDGEATGKPLGTSGTNQNYGHVEIPAEVTSDVAKSILITGATPHGDWLEGTVPSDLDTINRGSSISANSSLDSTSGGKTIYGSALVINTSVPVTITNLKITGGNSGKGGGIRTAEGSRVSLGDGLLLTENRAERGGAIYNLGTLFIYGSTIIGNKDATVCAPTTYSATTDSNGNPVAAPSNYSNSTGGAIFNGPDVNSDSASSAKLYLGYITETKEQTFTGGIYYNYGSSGGAIYNAAHSKVYMNSGTIEKNTASSGGGGIYNNANGYVKFSNGNIFNNLVLTDSSADGGGVYNAKSSSIFEMAGGTINKNVAMNNYSGQQTARGGGVFNRGKFFMYGNAVIGMRDADHTAVYDADNPENNYFGNKAQGGAGVYNDYNSASGYNGQFFMGYKPTDENATSYEPEELRGGILCNYGHEPSSGNSYVTDGGGIYSNSTLKISSGSISYNVTSGKGGGICYALSQTTLDIAYGILEANSANDAGNAIFMATGNTQKLILSGSPVIAPGENDENDIYLQGTSASQIAKINIAGFLEGSFKAVLTPQTYDESYQLVNLTSDFRTELGDGAATELEAECKCFSVTSQTKDSGGNVLSTPINWKIDDNGYLYIVPSITVTRTDSNTITHSSGELDFELSNIDVDSYDYIYLELYSKENEGSEWELEDADEGHRYSSGTIDDDKSKHKFEIVSLSTEIHIYKIVFLDHEDNVLAEYEFEIE